MALREIGCGEPGASSVIIKFAVRWPAPIGLKTSEIVQLAAGATGAVQLLVKLKSERLGPPRATDETWRGAVPELMTRSVCTAPDVPWVLVGNEGAAGTQGTALAGATPGP